MSRKFEEVITVKMPQGTREELHKLAEKRYLTIGSVVRVAIMREIEEERRKTVKSAA